MKERKHETKEETKTAKEKVPVQQKIKTRLLKDCTYDKARQR